MEYFFYFCVIIVCFFFSYSWLHIFHFCLFKLFSQAEMMTGSQWVSLAALRAVNQAIGRVIRHRNDFGAIILADGRFYDPPTLALISSWVRPGVKHCTVFGQMLSQVTLFFRAMKVKFPDQFPDALYSSSSSNATPTRTTSLSKGVKSYAAGDSNISSSSSNSGSILLADNNSFSASLMDPTEFDNYSEYADIAAESRQTMGNNDGRDDLNMPTDNTTANTNTNTHLNAFSSLVSPSIFQNQTQSHVQGRAPMSAIASIMNRTNPSLRHVAALSIAAITSIVPVNNMTVSALDSNASTTRSKVDTNSPISTSKTFGKTDFIKNFLGRSSSDPSLSVMPFNHLGLSRKDSAILSWDIIRFGIPSTLRVKARSLSLSLVKEVRTAFESAAASEEDKKAARLLVFTLMKEYVGILASLPLTLSIAASQRSNCKAVQILEARESVKRVVSNPACLPFTLRRAIDEDDVSRAQDAFAPNTAEVLFAKSLLAQEFTSHFAASREAVQVLCQDRVVFGKELAVEACISCLGDSVKKQLWDMYFEHINAATMGR